MVRVAPFVHAVSARRKLPFSALKLTMFCSNSDRGSSTVRFFWFDFSKKLARPLTHPSILPPTHPTTQFTRLVETITTQFNERYEEIRKQWGGGLVGLKSQAKIDAANRALKREAIARAV